MLFRESEQEQIIDEVEENQNKAKINRRAYSLGRLFFLLTIRPQIPFLLLTGEIGAT